MLLPAGELAEDDSCCIESRGMAGLQDKLFVLNYKKGLAIRCASATSRPLCASASPSWVRSHLMFTLAGTSQGPGFFSAEDPC